MRGEVGRGINPIDAADHHPTFPTALAAAAPLPRLL